MISYVDSGLEGRHPVVVRCDGSWFLSSVSIVESDRPIVPISFYRTDDKRSLPSRIDIGMAVQSVYPRGLFHRGCNGATTTDAFCSLGGHFRQLSEYISTRYHLLSKECELTIDNVEPNVLAVVIYCRFDLPHGLKSDLSRSGHPSI